MVKRKAVLSHARLGVMIRDLERMRDEMVGKQFAGPNADLQAAGLSPEELKNMDEFSKIKARLNVKISQLNEVRSFSECTKGGARLPSATGIVESLAAL